MTGFRITNAVSKQDVAAVTALFGAYARSIGVDLAYQGFEAEMAAMPENTLPIMGAAIGLYEAPGFVRIDPYYQTPIEGTLFFSKRL